ncbi:uncharacterized protein BDZ99DRAFT_481262 [Mytilinidion resinicola]|uniref:Myb-like domain-containing protein n=1 Tax=Mytilinidion resinicola TaxID=574789 RepID=A0A6A6Y771_9PEZI|nr:uncharacterized protein BDZ99DRAFT_481262 [Mytilinidion resinicola]KAF2804449.1 hypothetical protein BDZ99DRAFT_481262 [Mytilinidion resinicola]
MATVSTFPIATSLSKAFIHFNPSTLKPESKPESKPRKSKSQAKKPNITERNLSEDDSHRCDEEWANINNLLPGLSGSNALRSLDPEPLVAVGATSPSDGEGDFSTISPPQILQTQQPGQEGPCLTADMDLAVDGFNRSSLEFAFVLDNFAAGASPGMDDTQSSGQPREYQDNSLDAAGMRAFSVESTAPAYNDKEPAICKIGGRDNGADTLDLPRSDLLYLQNSGDSKQHEGLERIGRLSLAPYKHPLQERRLCCLLPYAKGLVDCNSNYSRPRQSRTVLSADQSNPHSNTASYNADHADSHISEEDEDDDGDEDKTEYRPYAISPDPRFNRGEMRFRPRTRVLWLESDKLQLLTYKNNMAIEWKKIFKLFPDRTPGAIRTRYYMLQGKSSIATTKVDGAPLQAPEVKAFNTPKLQRWKDVKVRRRLSYETTLETCNVRFAEEISR